MQKRYDIWVLLAILIIMLVIAYNMGVLDDMSIRGRD